MIHGIGPLPSTIIKKGTAAKKKALSNAEKVRLNKLKNAANARKNKANRSKNAINASDVALARLLKKNKGARMSTGGIKKAQTGRTMGRVYQGPLNKSDIDKLDRWYPSTTTKIPEAPKEANLIRGLNPIIDGKMISNEERESLYRNRDENLMRKPKGVYKKGGATKTAQMKKGGATGDKKWIQKAINPKHKGYCTPMTKPTCTPKRKALAKTLKAMAKKR